MNKGEQSASMDIHEDQFLDDGPPGVSYIQVAQGGVVNSLTYEQWKQGPGYSGTLDAKAQRVREYSAQQAESLRNTGKGESPFDYSVVAEPNNQYDPGHPVSLISDSGHAVFTDLDQKVKKGRQGLSKNSLAYHEQRFENITTDRPNDYVELATLSCLLNFIIGLVAINFSFRSQEAWYAGDRKWAKAHGLVAMVLSLISIASIVVLVVCLLWYYLPRDPSQCIHTFSNGTTVKLDGNCPKFA